MTVDLLVQGGEVVTADAVLTGGWVSITDGHIVGVGSAQDPAPAAERTLSAGEGSVLPGFIDLHVHGAAGASFDLGAEQIELGLAAHRREGTTRSLVSLVSASVDVMAARIQAAVAATASDPRVLGLHLEGPFLSELRRGVHDPAVLRAPDPRSLATLLEAGAGQVRVVTIAPELEGGMGAVRSLVDQGVHAAVGHSDASYEQARAAFDAGADLVTHAFNGMRPLHHRDPAIIGAAMDSPHVILEAINDGIHLHPAAVRLLRSVAPGRLALVTDAMAAACHGDGDYELAGFPVQVRDGVARIRTDDGSEGSIAGSTLTMAGAVRQAVREVGMSLLDASAAASGVPARLLGVDDRFGSIAVGKAADLVLLDHDFYVREVLIDGLSVSRT